MPSRCTFLSSTPRSLALAFCVCGWLAGPSFAAPPSDANAPYARSQPAYPRGDRAVDDRGGGIRRDPLPWNQLDASQQAFLRPLKAHWDQLPPARQHRIALRVQRWNQLPPERQAQIRDNISRFAQMTPEQRRDAARGERNFQAMAPADRQRVVEARRRFMQSLTPEERQELREKFRAEREARQRARQGAMPADASGSR